MSEKSSRIESSSCVLTKETNDENFDSENFQNNDNEKENSKWPLTTYFILVVELCERFCYYGLRSVLVLFLKDYYGLNEKEASSYYHIFGAMAYGFPMVGAIISDTYWGRYKTIRNIGLIYCLGISLLCVSAVPIWFAPFDPERNIHKILSLLGIAFIGIGSGGIKPCVSSFGADQFKPNQEKAKNQYFQWFYFIINVGGVIGAFLTPLLKKRDCYPSISENDPKVLATFSSAGMKLSFDSCHMLSFLVPALMMYLGLSLFIMPVILFKLCRNKKLQYTLKEPAKDYMIFKVFGTWITCVLGFFSGHRNNNCENLKEEGFINRSYEKSAHVRRVSYRILQITLVFIPMMVFYAVFEQLGSLWLFQAKELDGWIISPKNQYFSENLKYWQPDQMEIWNNFFVVLMIPIWTTFCLPIVDKYVFDRSEKLHRNRPFVFMFCGLLIGGLSNIYGYFLQIKISASLAFNDDEMAFSVYNLQDQQMGPKVEVFEKDQNITKNYSHHFTDLKHELPAVFLLDPESSDQPIYLSAKLINPQKNGQVRVINLNLNSQFEIVNSDFETNCTNTDYENSAIYLQSENNTCQKILNGRQYNMYWQIPQYAIVTFGEILIATTALEFAYTQSPASSKALCTGIWHLMTCLANILCIFLKKMDSWSRANQMLASSLFSFASGLVFILIVRQFRVMRYHEIEHLDRPDTQEDQNNERENLKNTTLSSSHNSSTDSSNLYESKNFLMP